MTKKQFLEFIKTIKKDFEYDFLSDEFTILNNFFINHPSYLDKIKDGINAYIYSQNVTFKNCYCFFIITPSKEKIAISYNFTKVKKDNKWEVLSAMRSAGDPDIYLFKKTFKLGETKCALTGSILSEKYHIDHYDLDFIEVVNKFLEKHSLNFDVLVKYVIELDTKRHFNNQKLINAFRMFHNQNTNLRFTTPEANLSRSKTYSK
jgi:hypothetical protein